MYHREFEVQHRRAKYCPPCSNDKAKQKQYRRALQKQMSPSGWNGLIRFVSEQFFARHVQARMPQELLQAEHVPSVAQVAYRERVAERVG
jgi:hypothetical protein